MRSLVKLSIIFLVATLLGCGPRGESNSLNQIYERSQKRFQAGMNSDSINQSIKPLLTQVAEGAEALIGDSSGKTIATGLADILSRCSEKASPTTRQAIYELSMQLRAMSEEANNPSPGERMLIVSRIYDAVAAELETVGFKN